MAESTVDRIRRTQKEHQLQQISDVEMTTQPDGTEVWTEAPSKEAHHPTPEPEVEINKRYVVIDQPGGDPDVLDEDILNQKKQEAMDGLRDWFQFSFCGFPQGLRNIFDDI